MTLWRRAAVLEPWDGATGNQPGGLAVAVERKVGIDFQGELWLLRSNGAGGFTTRPSWPRPAWPFS